MAGSQVTENKGGGKWLVCVVGLLMATLLLLVAEPASAVSDLTAPKLASVSASPAALAKGSTVTINYAAADDISGVSSARFIYVDKIGGQHVIVGSGPSAPGTATAVLRDNFVLNESWPDGDYSLSYASVTDNAGNTTNYGRDGTVSIEPSGAFAPAGQPLDLSSGDFKIVVPPGDTSTPILKSIKTNYDGVYSAGMTFSVIYEASDDLSGIWLTSFLYTNPKGNPLTLYDDAAAGFAQASTSSWSLGAYTLQSISLHDNAGNTIVYARNGSTAKTPADATGPTNHELNFESGDFTLGPAYDQLGPPQTITPVGQTPSAVTPVPQTPSVSPNSLSVSTPSGNGYWLVASDGGIFAFGDAAFYGSTGAMNLNQPIVTMMATPTGKGYWLVASDGGIFSFGDAQFFGSTGGTKLNKPIVGSAPTPSGKGYWLVASDGGIFAYGDAQFYGSTGASAINKPIVSMVPTPSGHGYWLVASDGGIFAFGDAQFFGSTGALALNKPIVGAAATPSGNGYWLVASDGGIFALGDAGFYGSTGAMKLNQPIVTMMATPTGKGYWLVASDGGIFAFGDAQFFGSTGSMKLNKSIVGAH